MLHTDTYRFYFSYLEAIFDYILVIAHSPQHIAAHIITGVF